MNKRTTLLSLLLAAMISGVAFAHSGGGAKGGGGDGMGGGMDRGGHSTMGAMGRGMMGPGGMGSGMMSMPMMSAEDLTDEQLDKLGEQMQRMHEQMEKIYSAKDPVSRREAVKQHLESMQAFMHDRRDMMPEQAPGRQDGGRWQQNMEERMRRMEQMLQRQ